MIFSKGRVICLKQWKKKVQQFFKEMYGLDELGKALIVVNVILYLIANVTKNNFILCLSFFVALFFFYRCFSRQRYDRNEENCKFNRYIKLWKVRYENRKTFRIFMCSECGQMIRVPKGKGKLQITCPHCGRKITRYT